MKTLQYLFITFLAFSMNISCPAQDNNKATETKMTAAEKVDVYYFHYSRRCMTCRSVENTSKEAVAEFYGNEVNFADYNLEEPEGAEKGKQLGVAGQTLLIVSGDTKLDITTEGFMNARNPEKLKQIIKAKIDPLL